MMTGTAALFGYAKALVAQAREGGVVMAPFLVYSAVDLLAALEADVSRPRRGTVICWIEQYVLVDSELRVSAADLERACRFVLDREVDSDGAGRIIHKVSSSEREYAQEDIVIDLVDLLSSVEAGIRRYEAELKGHHDRAMNAGTSPINRWWNRYYEDVA